MSAPQPSKLYARFGDCFLRAQQALPLRDQYQPEVGWARLSRVMSLAPIISLDFSRSNARGRSDLHSPKGAWTSLAHTSPGTLQDWRGRNAASSPFRQNGVFSPRSDRLSGVRGQQICCGQQIDGIGRPHARLCIAAPDPPDDARVPRVG